MCKIIRKSTEGVRKWQTNIRIMGGYFNKFKNILLTDVKKFNIYLLLIVSLIIIGSVGYTSYSLFSYEVYSDSIYVSFKDEEKPVCVIGEPAVSLMEKSSTTTFEMNCTDNYTVVDKDLTTSNFTKTGDITVTSVEKEKVGKAMKYIITVTSGTTGGVASIKLNAGAVTDTVGNGNLVSNTSEVFVRVTCDAMSEDVSGANSPEVSLASNMIPVCYNSAANVWVKADSTNTSTDYPWYSYSDKKWANAVTVTEENGTRDDLVDAEVGTPVPMDRINTMWVWIPRFSATGDTANYNGGYSSSPGAFNITFVDKETNAHDAFTFGSAVSGFWMGKFENSSNVSCTTSNNSAVGSGCNLNTIRPKIKPNVIRWRGASVSTIFYDILKMTESDNQYGFDKTIDVNLDTHMLRNNEWGAVAYLTQSIYGRCTSSTSCKEMGINNSSSGYTGNGAPAGSSISISNGAYNTTLGMDASTTGNIYGVYDMTGGAAEYVMGNYNNTKGSSQFTTLPNTKYYNVYTTSDDYTSAGLQHAMIETSGWYNNESNFIYSGYPWVTRGGNYSDPVKTGIFNFSYNDGGANNLVSSRTSIIIN